jgi:hypothetical protein
MTPLSALASFLQGFAAFLTIVAGYLLCPVVAILLLILAEFASETRRVRVRAHRIN